VGQELVVAHRDRGEDPPEDVAEEIVAGLRKDRFENRVGRIKQLSVIGRISPSLADSIAARATG